MECKAENKVEIFEKLCHIVEWAQPMSAIRVKENETDTQTRHLGETLYALTDKVRKLSDDPDTAFLVHAVVAKYWRAFYPTIVIPASDVIDGRTDRLDEVRSFIDDLKNDPAQAEWARLAEQIKSTADKTGYQITHPYFNDLAAISDIVYDAITANKTFIASTPYRLKSGPRSNQKPIMLNGIGIFSSVAEAFHAYENISVDAFVAFFGIEQTCGQTDDEFEEWRNEGKGTERMRNVMNVNSGGSGMTKEEYKKKIDDFSRRVFVIIRDGGNIYMMPIPVHSSAYENAYTKKYDTYGVRHSYAPTQIFFKEAAPAPSGTISLVPYQQNKHWRLSDIIDEEQQIWLPIFFVKTVERFFTDEPPKCANAYCPEETMIYRAAEIEDTRKSSNFITIRDGKKVVAVTRFKSMQPWRTEYTIPEPEEVFTADEKATRRLYAAMNAGDRKMFECGARLCKEFGITSKDIADIPIKCCSFCTEEQALVTMRENVILAYCVKIGEKCSEKWDAELNSTVEWYQDKIRHNVLKIRDKAIRGEYSFATTRVHKRPVLNPDGTPMMKKRYSYSQDTDLEPVLEYTDIDEGKIQWRGRLHELRFWYPGSLVGKHPPVVVFVDPQTPEDLAELLEMPVDEMPFLCRYYKLLYLFYCQKNRYTYRTDCDIKAGVRFLFGKKEFKNAVTQANAQEVNNASISR